MFKLGLATLKETVLYSFTQAAGANGEQPVGGVVLDVKRNVLYGTTQFGGKTANGAQGFGTIFRVDLNAAAPTGEIPIYDFTNGADGQQPIAGLIYDQSTQTIYGTSSLGGVSFGSGMLFSAVISTGASVVLHTFAGGNDGGMPSADLIEVNGVLYGTTAIGGGGQGSECFASIGNYNKGCGTVFEMTP